ncbi:MAG: alpha/beta fold hydrolase [Nitrospira sp.]|nr:alpha/beta fold hydrolase [Nitrospira sp.]MCP9443129.1 alpha/beta fold hydrolase [Nitrospira sp.]
MEEYCSFLDHHGHRVASLLTTPDGATDRVAVLCHGFLSSKTSTTNKTLTRTLIDRGIATLCFDFFGHGESQGPFEHITNTVAVGQTLAALDFVRLKGYRRVGLMGSSFGGLVAILTAAQRTDLACLALKCPVVDFAEELRLEFGEEEMTRWKATDTVPNILGGQDRVPLRYAFYEDCLRSIAYEPASAITAPTLIVQGDRDEHVPLHQSQRLYERLRVKKRLEMIPGADHQFTRREDFLQMTASIANWLATHLM